MKKGKGKGKGKGPAPAGEYFRTRGARGNRTWFPRRGLSAVIGRDRHGHRHLAPSREDGPALEFSNGTKIWHDAEGLPHREDGPAMENPGGNHYWYKHGMPDGREHPDSWRSRGLKRLGNHPPTMRQEPPA